MKEVTINGVTYEAVDTPIEDDKGCTCRECDIYKACPPKNMMGIPLCCIKGNKKIRKSCCEMQKKGIDRIWKIKYQS